MEIGESIDGRIARLKVRASRETRDDRLRTLQEIAQLQYLSGKLSAAESTERHIVSMTTRRHTEKEVNRWALYNIAEIIKFQRPIESAAILLELIKEFIDPRSEFELIVLSQCVHAMAHVVAGEWQVLPARESRIVSGNARIGRVYITQPLSVRSDHELIFEFPRVVDDPEHYGLPETSGLKTVIARIEPGGDTNNSGLARLSMALHQWVVALLTFATEREQLSTKRVHEQLARSRDCCAHGLAIAGHTSKARELVLLSLDHWNSVPNLDDQQKYRRISALKTLATICMADGDYEGANYYHKVAMAHINTMPSTGHGEIIESHSYIMLVTLIGSLEGRLRLLMMSRQIAVRVGDFNELAICDSLIAEHACKSPEQAFVWMLSAVLARIAWCHESGSSWVSLERKLRRPVGKLWRLAVTTRHHYLFAMALCAMNSPSRVYDVVHAVLTETPSKPLAVEWAIHYRDFEQITGRRAVLISSGLCGDWYAAYYSVSGQWSISRTHDENERVARTVASLERLRWDTLSTKHLDELIRHDNRGPNLGDAVSLLPQELKWDISRLRKSDQCLKLSIVPCGSSAQVIPFSMIPLSLDPGFPRYLQYVMEYCEVDYLAVSDRGSRKSEKCQEYDSPIEKIYSVLPSPQHAQGSDIVARWVQVCNIRDLRSLTTEPRCRAIVHLGGSSVSKVSHGKPIAGIEIQGSRVFEEDLQGLIADRPVTLIAAGCSTMATQTRGRYVDWGGLLKSKIGGRYSSIGTVLAIPDDGVMREIELSLVEALSRDSVDPAKAIRDLQLAQAFRIRDSQGTADALPAVYWVPFISVSYYLSDT